MSYTPTTWTTGDTITATKLNKIENGIASAGSVLICTSSYDSNEDKFVLDKTAGEIYDALLAGTPVYIKYQYASINDYTGILYLAPVIKIYNYDETNLIRICASKPSFVGIIGSKNSSFSPSILIYSASGLNDYPVFFTTIYVPSNYVATTGAD